MVSSTDTDRLALWQRQYLKIKQCIDRWAVAKAHPALTKEAMASGMERDQAPSGSHSNSKSGLSM